MGVGGEVHASASLTPGEEPSTHGKLGSVGPIVGLDEYVKVKISCPHQDSNPELSSL
jgi:hypothetical protein